jgi:hypothetical protein
MTLAEVEAMLGPRQPGAGMWTVTDAGETTRIWSGKRWGGERAIVFVVFDGSDRVRSAFPGTVNFGAPAPPDLTRDPLGWAKWHWRRWFPNPEQ